ncbi:MAG: CAP domain-containing protein [Acidimicrobiales bacterium]
MLSALGQNRSRLLAVPAALALLVGGVLSSFGLVGSTPPAAASTAVAAAPAVPVSIAGDEAAFFDAINHSRWQSGRAPLTLDPAAADVARAWSAQMDANDQLRHNPNLQADVERRVTTQWQRIGENVGVGWSVNSLHDAFMASQGHRDNILGDFNRVGVGVVREPGGRIWVTAVFIKGPAIAPPPPVGSSPIGSVDVVQRVPGAVRVTGWSLDLDTAAPTDVHVYVGPFGKAASAAAPRGDIGAAFPGYGDGHGFDVTVPVLPGTYDVCVYGINAAGGGGNSLLGCRRMHVPGAPVGSVDSVSWSMGRATISGWTLDPDVEWSIDTHIYVDGVGVPVTANKDRGDIASAFPGYGSAHGFSVTVPMSAGLHTVCAYGIGAGAGGNSALGCRTVDLPASPRGALDGVWRVPGGVAVAGWALDPETAQPIPVHVYAGPVGEALTADESRLDIASVFPGYGDWHGFEEFVPTGSAPVQVCAYGINVGAGGNSLLGCRTV